MFGNDPTLYNYNETFGQTAYTSNFTETEDYRARLNNIPAYSLSVFFDLHEIRAYTPTGNITVFGSVQSDRLSCRGEGGGDCQFD